MARKRSYTPLDLFINRRRVGKLRRESTGLISFTYDPTWLEWKSNLPISLSLPLREDSYSGQPVQAVFENLLPDSVHIRKRLAERVGAEGTGAYALLAKIGRDCVGALQFLPEGEEPDPLAVPSGAPVGEEQIATLLRNLKVSPLGLRKDADFRISIAGAQDKTALLWNNGQWYEPTGTSPTSHIFKPQIGVLPNGIDLSQSVENEHFCLQLMKEFGLPVATTRMARFGEIEALIVERFDRAWTKGKFLIRLPQEDCCQALGVPPTMKYQSEGGPGIVEITKLLQGSDEPLRDQNYFFQAIILFWLIGATDGHAKNFSIALTPGGRFTMTPLYDVLSAQPALDAGQIQIKEMRLAMRLGKSRRYRVDEILGHHCVETGKEAGLSRKQIGLVFDQIQSHAQTALSNVSSALPENFPEEIVNSVSRGLLNRLARLKVDE